MGLMKINNIKFKPEKKGKINTTEGKTFRHTQDKDWNGKETDEISSVLKSL